MYCAVADNDDKREPTAKDELKRLSPRRRRWRRVEVYDGANHGWCVKGSPTYNEAAAERAWAELLALYKTLG